MPSATHQNLEDPLNPENPIRADLALAGHKDGCIRRVIVIEVQLGEDLNKEWTTVLYRAGLRRRHECPVWAIWFDRLGELIVRAATITALTELFPTEG